MGEMTHQEKRREFNTIAHHLRKQRHFCINCGSAEKIEFHHIVPLGMGGTNALTNIVPLCAACHLYAAGKNYHKKPGVKHGRSKKKPPDGYQEALADYFNQRIGKTELMRRLGISYPTFTDKWWVREYREQHGVPEDFYNHVDIKEAAKRRKKRDEQ